jgi:hypothetical protein
VVIQNEVIEPSEERTDSDMRTYLTPSLRPATIACCNNCSSSANDVRAITELTGAAITVVTVAATAVAVTTAADVRMLAVAAPTFGTDARVVGACLAADGACVGGAATLAATAVVVDVATAIGGVARRGGLVAMGTGWLVAIA